MKEEIYFDWYIDKLNDTFVFNKVDKLNIIGEDKFDKCLFYNTDIETLCDKYHLKIERIPTDDYKTGIIVFHNNHGNSKVKTFLIYPYELYDSPIDWGINIGNDETFLTRMNMMIDEISVFLPEIKELEFNNIKKRMFMLEE